MKMEKTECSETPAYKIRTPGNYPEESIQHTEHGESLKSRIGNSFCSFSSYLTQNTVCKSNRKLFLQLQFLPYPEYSLYN